MMAENDLISLRLKGVSWHNELVNSYEFVSADGAHLPPFTAGAHVGLVLPVGERSYSLLNDPSETHRYVLGIARERNGRGGSDYIHEQLKVGAVLMASPPKNLFPLHEGDAPALLIAGGIGITPMLSMAAHMEALGRPWRLVYAVRGVEQEAFSSEISRWPGKVTVHRDKDAGGVLDLKKLVEEAAPETHFYCCGPGPMLASYVEACASRPQENVHLERFSAELPPPVNSGGFEVVLAKSGKCIRVKEEQSILQALEEAGVSAPRSCEQGICGVCETRLLDGIPDHRDSLLSEQERSANNVIMICCSRALTPSLTLDL
ncbi:oxidoreductase [Hydrogenophaga sp. YM1]|uniref:PDR/VanB family oxidoreductase n=1 Tax=Hydrogenophaga sp. YM1 TaxID=2806262 RepID=UPI001956EE50|nr:PDR/VanB family oxidoreductase [Hydrogenophaga sp. YM1]QRR35607.1 oxidoreductase [Hydrogenophaga sp. YM1]